jgi:hypothetical protein
MSREPFLILPPAAHRRDAQSRCVLQRSPFDPYGYMHVFCSSSSVGSNDVPIEIGGSEYALRDCSRQALIRYFGSGRENAM